MFFFGAMCISYLSKGCVSSSHPGPLGIPTGTVQPRELGGHVAVVDFCGWDHG